MKTRKDHICELLNNVQFADPMKYTFLVVEDVQDNTVYPAQPGAVYLQAYYEDEDTFTHEKSTQYTRKWHISDEATDSQIIQTAFKLCLTSAEHRVREAFMYKGVRVFGPHWDVEDLVALGRGTGQWNGAPKKDFRW
jgi:hypothetical protein